MTEINKTACDGPHCKNEIDHTSGLDGRYHALLLGGSDFEMSLGSERFDFCSIKCLMCFLRKHYPEETK